jgi:phage terminase small subunit
MTMATSNTSGKKPPPKSVGKRDEFTPLTAREQRFVLAYTTTCNFTDPQKAALEAGYAKTRVHVQAYEILARPNVAKAINEAKARVRAIAEAEAGITLGDVVRKIGEVAFFDPRKLYDDKGGILPPHLWPDAIAAAIAGVKVLEEFKDDPAGGRAHVGQTKEVKLIERTKALDMLMKHLGGYEKDNDQRSKAGGEAVQELINAIRQVQGDACRLPIAATNRG